METYNTSLPEADQASMLKRAEMLLHISQAMAASETLDQMLETLLQIITKEVNAERGTIFLHDPESDELYSRVVQSDFKQEIRIPKKSGIAGLVFTVGEGMIVNDPYHNKHFDKSTDQKTGFTTKHILCAPIRTVKDEVIGVAQVLNKKEGVFTENDLALLEAMTSQAAVALQTTQFIERINKVRKQEEEFFKVVSDVISEIDLGSILGKVMSQATKMLDAERATLFLNDDKTNELFVQVGTGLGASQIRLKNDRGIAGAVFTSGQSVNIPHAYADLRFDPSFDRKSGFFTRSILCVPVVNKSGVVIGVTQVLNKRGGPFTSEDEKRLRTFTGQIAIALENAKLFADVQTIRKYNESMLESMTNGVITLNEDEKIVTCNAAGLRIMKINSEDAKKVLNCDAKDFFTGANSWILEKVRRVAENGEQEEAMDAEIEFGDERISVNLTVVPLFSGDKLITGQKKKLGSMIMMEDITEHKRMKSTMYRYLDPSVADRLLAKGEDILGGKSTIGTVLFSDIRGFTTLTEELGAQGTVSLLNEYFTKMVDCIEKEEGILDKFIGDAVMAVFGIPLTHDDDEDRAVRTAISMIMTLNQWNAERAEHGKRPVFIGIGVNTDWVVSGNIGSPKRMNYTIIGDGVNLASRLEAACKQYFARILISENTFKKLRGTYRIREIDSVIVKGKTEPVGVYEVLDYHTEQTFPNLMEVVNHFRNGLMRYREKQWDKAIKSFEEACSLNKHDKLSQMYIDRCIHYKQNPPDNGWNGVWVMTSK